MGGEKQGTWQRIILHAEGIEQHSECTGEPRTSRQDWICVSERKRMRGREIWSQKDQFKEGREGMRWGGRTAQLVKSLHG